MPHRRHAAPSLNRKDGGIAPLTFGNHWTVGPTSSSLQQSVDFMVVVAVVAVLAVVMVIVPCIV